MYYTLSLQVLKLFFFFLTSRNPVKSPRRVTLTTRRIFLGKSYLNVHFRGTEIEFNFKGTNARAIKKKNNNKYFPVIVSRENSVKSTIIAHCVL